MLKVLWDGWAKAAVGWPAVTEGCLVSYTEARSYAWCVSSSVCQASNIDYL